jgi:predicted  nucleic acid-binding Zn-ribbon protein
MDDSKKARELEKRVTKLRNDNQQLSTQLDKATRLLEREIGEVVDIDSLSKEESQWKGRA